MTIAALLPLLLSLLSQAPQAYESIQSIWRLATQDNEPTPEEKAQFDAASAAAHRAVQNM